MLHAGFSYQCGILPVSNANPSFVLHRVESVCAVSIHTQACISEGMELKTAHGLLSLLEQVEQQC